MDTECENVAHQMYTAGGTTRVCMWRRVRVATPEMSIYQKMQKQANGSNGIKSEHADAKQYNVILGRVRHGRDRYVLGGDDSDLRQRRSESAVVGDGSGPAQRPLVLLRDAHTQWV